MKLNEIAIPSNHPIALLKAFVLKNYEDGGDEVYETFDDTDYEAVLNKCEGDLAMAKRHLQNHWKLIKDVGDDIRGS